MQTTLLSRLSLMGGLLAAVLLVAPQGVMAQDGTDATVVPAPEVRQSPVAIAATRLDDNAYVKVVYGSPRMRGREIYGGLVPFNQVWRTGANEATEITFTAPVNFGGQMLDAGTYALFTIPGPETWTIILNGGLGQWGSYEYDESQDVLRVQAPANRSESRYEAFTIRLDESGSGADLVLLWDQTRVAVPISLQ